MDYIQSNYKNIPMMSFLPHGGFTSDNKIKKLKDREIDVFFSGSYGDAENIYNDFIKNMGRYPLIKNIFDESADVMKTDENLIFSEVLNTKSLPYKKIIEDSFVNDYSEVMELMGFELDGYIRQY